MRIGKGLGREKRKDSKRTQDTTAPILIDFFRCFALETCSVGAVTRARAVLVFV